MRRYCITRLVFLLVTFIGDQYFIINGVFGFDEAILIEPNRALLFNNKNDYWIWQIDKHRIKHVENIFTDLSKNQTELVEFAWVPYMKNFGLTEEWFELDYGKLCLTLNDVNVLFHVRYIEKSNSIQMIRSKSDHCDNYVLGDVNSTCSLTILPIVPNSCHDDKYIRYSSAMIIGNVYNKYSYIIIDHKYESLGKNRLILIRYKYKRHHDHYQQTDRWNEDNYTITKCIYLKCDTNNLNHLPNVTRLKRSVDIISMIAENIQIENKLEKHGERNTYPSTKNDTTRKPRINEQDGIAYHFVDKATFQRMISNNEFVEYAQFSGNYYGTSFRELNIVKCSGRIPILDVDVRGVMNLKRINFGAIYIFITTSSLDNLERNLRQRGTEDNETLNRRLRHAIEDIKTAEKLKFDLIIINQDLTESFEKIKNFVEKDVNLLRQNCQ
ncbi:hypothetical protein RDWZM_005832 [Blomia tropicalis]|uniref:Guanylate kinase-like domain-containing protein n=1 Tax=Blomia tropicalis TaxID=40697 RepID=A0A9Q0M6C2_BLOTA|nr:hypothetical protein RDWZM_005832 [Blomia tropicalis]